MRATLEYIERKFREYNRQMFHSSLPTPGFRLSNARTALGKLTYMQRRNPAGKVEKYAFTLWVSKLFDFTPEGIDDVIIHEMIHLYIGSRQMRDTSSHGVVFRRIMNEINSRYGRHIEIANRSGGTSPAERAKPAAPQSCPPTYFAVVRLKNGTTGIMAVAMTRIFELWRAVGRSPEVEQAEWYVSTDPYFAGFPKSRSPRIRLVGPEEYEPHLRTAHRLENTGHIILPVTTA